MSPDSPLVPLIGASVALLGLVGILVFGVMKMRSARRGDAAGGRERLSEEAFAAATIKAALAAHGGGGSGPAQALAAPPAVAPDSLDAAALEALPFGVIVTDEAGVIRRVTAAARGWLGLTAPMTGHPARSTLATWPALADACVRAHAGEAAPAVDVTLPSGTTLTVTATRWVPRAGRGGVVLTLAPAPAPASASAAAADETTSATEADTETSAGLPGTIGDVSRLASGLAHELANSLTTIHGYAHLVDRRVLTEADRAALEHIQSSSEHMLKTIEAFRSLVRPLPIALTTFAPADAVHAAVALARQEAGQPEAPVQVSVSPSATVSGDRVLLEDAIAAVVRNAIEASATMTPLPAVDVRVSQPAGAGRVEIVVADRGPGVPADIRPRVFQPFLTDKPGHDGLGLARAAHVLRAHPGASMTLDHPAAGGLVVTIRLPIQS